MEVARATPVLSPKRSRSPAKKKKQPEQKEATPEEILLQNLGSWRLEDQGGCGDCGFRAIARSLGFNLNKDFNNEQLTTQASSLRLLMVSHLTKHKKDKDGGENSWAPDLLDTQAEWGGENPPSTYDEYLKLAAKRESWIDGRMLLGLSQRGGFPIIIWYYEPERKVWLRHVVAPWWQEGFAQTTRGQKPVMVALLDRHCRTLLPDTKDQQVPDTWLAETTVRPDSLFKGAGKSSPSCALSLASKTPSRVEKTKCESLKLQFGKSPKPRGKELSLPSRTPCKGSKQGGLSLPACTPKLHKAQASCSVVPVASMPNQEVEDWKAQQRKDNGSAKAVKPTLSEIPPVLGRNQFSRGKTTTTKRYIWRCPMCRAERKGIWKIYMHP